MPNTGRPSQDCHLCRQRRVKCDLARPGCQRCVKYGVDCPGYREQHELVFRNANPSSVKRRKKKVAAKEVDRDGGMTLSDGNTSRSSTPISHTSNPAGATFVFDSKSDPWPVSEQTMSSSVTTFPRPMAEHWTNHSVPILLNVYSTLSFLGNIYRMHSRNGPLIWAAHLFSRTYVTNIRYPISVHKESALETQRELGTYLGKTLSAVNGALKEPDGPFRDDVLATVWILASYELLIGSLRRMEPLSPWHLHTRGLYSILKTRGSAPLYTPEGRAAFWPCYNMIQIQSLVSNTECPPESEEWLGIIRNNLFEGEGYSLYVAVFITKCTHVQATILSLLRRRDFVAAEGQYESMVEQLTAADDELQNYANTKSDYNEKFDIYMRNLYCSAIIKGYSYLLLLANFLTHHASSRVPLHQLRSERAQFVKMVRVAAQSILDSIPVALGPLKTGKDKSPRVLFDSIKMVWPLTAVYLVGPTLPEQKNQAEIALTFIGKVVGVRQALNTYPGKMPLPLEARVPLDLMPGEASSPASSK